MRAQRMGIGALSKRTGVHIETIRYYEKAGVMLRPKRSAGGHRLYEDDAVRRLLFIRRARELGFALEEIRELLKLVDGGNYTCTEVKELTLRHAKDVHIKIGDLRKIENVLRDMAAQCEGGDVPDCPIVDTLYS